MESSQCLQMTSSSTYKTLNTDQKITRLNNEYSKDAGYKINTQSHLHAYTLAMIKQKEKLRGKSHSRLQREVQNT